MLIQQRFVELCQRFAGLEKTVAALEDLLGLQCMLDEHRQQRRGHAMSDGIGDVKTNVPLVETHHVIQIPANVSRWAVERVKANVAELRQTLGKKVLLEPGGKAQLFIEPMHVEIKRVVAPAKECQLIL